MKIKELISCLETAHQKLGIDAEVFVASAWGDDIIAITGGDREVEIDDVIIKAQQSLVSENLNSDEAKVIIKF